MAGRPLIIAHRGFSSQHPENTIAAAEAAIETGADMVEIDVQQTHDGEVVVFHDFLLRRLCGLEQRISDVTYAALRRRKSDIPTLPQMLAAVRNRCPLLIELKRADPAKVAAAIQSARMVDQVIVFAFAIPLLRDFAKVNPRIRRMGLTGADLTGSVRAIQESVEIEGLGVGNRLLRSQSDVRKLRRQVGKVFVWTVNRAARMEQLADWGVDGIITNRPDLARRVLA